MRQYSDLPEKRVIHNNLNFSCIEWFRWPVVFENVRVENAKKRADFVSRF